jgi:hypothetical protein
MWERGANRVALRRLIGYLYILRLGVMLGSAVFRVVATAVLRHALPPDQSSAVPRKGHVTQRDFKRVNVPGFGNRWNTYPWSMQWWAGKLYVGTNKSFPCVEYYVLHSAMPWLQRYPPRFDPDVACAACPFDLDLQAEIWEYTPGTARWARVYESPVDVPVPDHPSLRIARDIGYRNMAIVLEPDGTEALYVSAVSARPLDRRLPPPRLLRSTDGRTFAAIPADAGTVLGDVAAVGYRSWITYHDRHYVVATNLYGDGLLLETSNPGGGNNDYRYVLAPNLHVNEMAVYNDFLYLGLRHPLLGYQVVKTRAEGSPPYKLIPVVPHGAGRSILKRSHTVLSMCGFQDCLYVGTANPPELLRIYADDRWDIVVGQARSTSVGRKVPLSSLSDGFDYPLNNLIERMQVHDSQLYVGLVSFAGKYRRLPIVGRAVEVHRGFDLYATQDGVRFEMVTQTGFDSVGTTGVRTLASTPVGLFVGAINELAGAEVYLGHTIPP